MIVSNSSIQQDESFKLTPIFDYPFVLDETTPFFSFTYTILASLAAAKRVGVIAGGFRLLVTETETILVYVIFSPDLRNDSQYLYAPENIIRLGKEVKLRKISLKLLSPTIPDLIRPKKLYIYVYSKHQWMNELLKLILKCGSFVLNPGLCIFNLKWVHGLLSTQLPWRLRILLTAKLNLPPSQQRIPLWLEPINEFDSPMINPCLFSHNSTSFEIIHGINFKINIQDIVEQQNTVSQRINQLPEYKQLKMKIRDKAQINQDQHLIWIIKAEENIGLSECVIGWMGSYASLQIDCGMETNYFQLMKKIQKSVKNSSVVVCVHTQWALTLASVVQPSSTTHSVLKDVIVAFKTGSELSSSPCTLFLISKEAEMPNKPHFFVSFYHFTLSQDSKKQSMRIVLQNQPKRTVYLLNDVSHEQQYEKRRNQMNPVIEKKKEKDVFESLSKKMGWQRLEEVLRNRRGKERWKEAERIAGIKEQQIKSETQWQDVGGLEEVKEELKRTVLLPTEHPELFDELIRPRTGLLLYGPPGTGKTLLGKCVAHECGMTFLSVKGPQLLNMYVGESEKNLRQLFQRAASLSPCVVFMDELDALVPRRGSGVDSHQVMDRLVAELFLQLDQAPLNRVFVIGATNRPDLLDPSVLRAGRFDKQLYLGIPTDFTTRKNILRAQTRLLPLSPSFNISRVVQLLPQQPLSGADFYALTAKAVQVSIDRAISNNSETVEIKEEDFVAVIPTIHPSVSQQQLLRYEELQKQFK